MGGWWLSDILTLDGCYILWAIMLDSSSSESHILVTTIIIFHEVK